MGLITEYSRKAMALAGFVALFAICYQGTTAQTIVTPASSYGLYLIHYPNISTDRAANYEQEILASSYKAMRIRGTIPLTNTQVPQSLDASNGFTDYRLIERDLSAPLDSGVTLNAVLVASENGEEFFLQAGQMERGTTAAYLALPLTTTSKKFYLATYEAFDDGGIVRHTGFAVAALQDGTCVEAYRVNGNSYTRLGLWHLDAQEVFTGLSDGQGLNLKDYTGVMINATKPVATFGAHECAKIPTTISFCDAIVEQIPPVDELGTEHVLGPLRGRKDLGAGYEFRVVATELNTIINIRKSSSGSADGPFPLQRGQVYKGSTPNSLDSVWLTCSQKCLVTQYQKSKQAVTTVGGGNEGTDPFMMIIPPIDHYRSAMRFGTVKHYDYVNLVAVESNNFLTIVAKTAETGNIRLDGAAPTGGNWAAVPGSAPAYSVYATGVQPGFHSLANVGGAGGTVGGFSYGHGTVDNTGYGYTTGYQFNGAPIPGPWYSFDDVSTVGPVTDSPWSQTNFSSEYSQAELPVYKARYHGAFQVVDRTSNIIARVCSEGYRAFLTDRRLPDMSDRLSPELGTLCPGINSSQIVLNLDGPDAFITKYTTGDFYVTVSIYGGQGQSFRNIAECSKNLKSEMETLSNWPIYPIGSTTKTNNATYLQRWRNTMTTCAAVKMNPVRLTYTDVGWDCLKTTTTTTGGATVPRACSVNILFGTLLTLIIALRFTK